MKRLLIFSLLATIGSGALYCNKPQDYSFYIKVDSGVSASNSANICTPNPPWNTAVQGYNSKLGSCAIAGVSVGCELFNIVDLEVNLANRSTFKYRKFQTPTNGSASYTRQFDLDVTSIFFCANLLGRGIPYGHWNVGCGAIYPILGAGVGSSNLLITNFRTTSLPPSGDSAPFASFSSENQYTQRKNFTYAFLAGLEYNHNSYWALGTGYRWFDAGKFNGPQYLRVANGAAVDVGCDAWKMRFNANEWFVTFKIFI